jgi:hypothetical protein
LRQFTFHAFKTVRTTIEYEKVWRNDDTDAVYRSNGTAYAGTQAVRGHDVDASCGPGRLAADFASYLHRTR